MTAEHLELLRRRSMDDGGFGPRAMMRLKVCPHCGNVSAASRFFCRACGRRLSRHSLYQRYKQTHRCCPVCDTVTPDAACYCPQCGTPLRQSVP